MLREPRLDAPGLAAPPDGTGHRAAPTGSAPFGGRADPSADAFVPTVTNDPSIRQKFVSELLIPVLDGAGATPGAYGEPVLPPVFRWGTRSIEVAEVLRSWRETGACTHGSPEMYVRKHWYEIRTVDGRTARLYFERQPRWGRRRARWWLFSIGPREIE